MATLTVFAGADSLIGASYLLSSSTDKSHFVAAHPGGDYNDAAPYPKKARSMSDKSVSQDSKSDGVQDRVQHIIELIRPAVQEDDGDVELVEVTDDGVVKIRFHGECLKCPSRPLTLTHDIEKNLKAKIPEVTEVIEVE